MLTLSCAECIAGSAAGEFRGAWVTAWASGFLSPDEVDETLRLASEANINALFIQVRKVGDAYYKSRYEPRATNISGPEGYDPLAYVIERAHAAGIEAHAWINTFRVWARNGPPSDPSHVAVLHPDWVTRTPDGTQAADEGLFLDPGIQEVQDYTLNVVLDLAASYQVDGIHLDYVRYPGTRFGYAPAAVARFNQETGRSGVPSNSNPAWCEWRRNQVTNLVRRIYRAVTELNPRIKVTAATIPWGDCSRDFCDTTPFMLVYQDWRAWMEEGILDANIPMNYKNEGSPKNARQYRNWLDGFKRWQYGRHVYSGLDFNANAELVIRQLQASRKRGLEGMVGFSFNQSEGRAKLVQALRNGIYAQAASVPEMPWKNALVQRVSRQRYARAVDAATYGEDLDGAIVLLHEALRIDPAYADARYRLGRYYLRKGLYEEAVVQFENALKLNPNHAAARRRRDEALALIATRSSAVGRSYDGEGFEIAPRPGPGIV